VNHFELALRPLHRPQKQQHTSISSVLPINNTLDASVFLVRLIIHKEWVFVLSGSRSGEELCFGRHFGGVIESNR
jgi:hypothetical protein